MVAETIILKQGGSCCYNKQQRAGHVERGVVAALWQNIDHLLMSGSDVLDDSLWVLMDALPHIHELAPQQLPHLAQLHRSSAANLMATVRMLAPSAFCDAAASSPDEQLLLQLDSSLLSMVSCLVELQLFHLQRAALLSGASRRLAHVMAQAVSNSSCASSSDAHVCCTATYKGKNVGAKQ